VGRVISGPVRVFRNYDEATKRLFVNVRLMDVSVDDEPGLAA
jgi:hypothetical protein